MDQVSEITNGSAAVAITPRDEFSAKVDASRLIAPSASLIAQQHPEGYWQAALEANAEMNAEYIIFRRFMELERDHELEAKLKRLILDLQQPDGSWNLFPGGEGHLSTTVIEPISP